jgi:hypothetical protein
MRQEVLDSGELKKLAMVLLEPALRNKPKSIGLTAWLEFVFGTKERIIKRYFVNTPFKMPGVFHVSAMVKYQGRGPRKIKQGEEAFVRFLGDIVDVEICAHGKAAGWFSMDLITWGQIEKNFTLDRRSDDSCRKY